MSAGFYLTSGFIYLNMGCQMMFVLSNRMNAQNIDMSSVGLKIMSEITHTLCKPEFIEKIMKPQTPISIPVFQQSQLLSKIVNSSAMKLDKSSMEKLFYLILMTFKKQLFLCSSPLQLYSLTKTHIEDLIKMLKNNPAAVHVLQRSLEIFINSSQNYTFVQYLEIREEILSMLESYKSRIVLFVEVGHQTQTGQMIHFNRISHVRKQIGMGINHKNIDFKIATISIPKRRLQYKDYKQWKTDLGKDDYDNIRGSSKFAQSKKEEQVENERSITDFLKIKDLQLDAYEVKLDIFDDGSNVKAGKPKEKKKEQIKEQPVKMASDIINKISKEFDDLQMKQGEEGDLDLLDMMDGE